MPFLIGILRVALQVALPLIIQDWFQEKAAKRKERLKEAELKKAEEKTEKPGTSA